MYESVHEPVITRRQFLRRIARHILLAGGMIVGSLAVGIAGYMVFAHMHFVDAFLNASMILGGMGPVDPLDNTAAKVFAGLYAMYSGVVFLIAVGVIAAPVLHRILHKLHVDPDDGSSSS
jgi:hypothetical protein